MSLALPCVSSVPAHPPTCRHPAPALTGCPRGGSPFSPRFHPDCPPNRKTKPKNSKSEPEVWSEPSQGFEIRSYDGSNPASRTPLCRGRRPQVPPAARCRFGRELRANRGPACGELFPARSSQRRVTSPRGAGDISSCVTGDRTSCRDMRPGRVPVAPSSSCSPLPATARVGSASPAALLIHLVVGAKAVVMTMAWSEICGSRPG